MSVIIREGHFPHDNQRILALFTAYAESLGIDLTYQNFDGELASLPGKYASEQGGALLLAQLQPDRAEKRPAEREREREESGTVVGCVALRRNTDTWCEMKRLYVTPDARKTGAGIKLAQAVIQKARELGYGGIRLDTLPVMVPALTLYRRLGFVEIEKYYETPVEGTIFMGLEL